MCFNSKEVERKSRAVLFSPTKTIFDLLYFRSTCKKAHKRVFNTLKKKNKNDTLLLINFHSHFHLLAGTISSLQRTGSTTTS